MRLGACTLHLTNHPFQVLASRVVTRLRALVVLPTRDLVVQVRETFEAVAKGRGLKVQPRHKPLEVGKTNFGS